MLEITKKCLKNTQFQKFYLIIFIFLVTQSNRMIFPMMK